MPANDKMFGPGKSRTFAPFLAPAERQQLQDAIGFTAKPLPTFAEDLRSLARQYIDDGDGLKLRALCLLVADLYEQGWEVSSHGGTITFSPPGLARLGSETVDDIKDRVRQTLQTARLRQLAEASVRKFLERVERRRPRGGNKASVLDLIDDGAGLADQLKRINALPDESREEDLRSLVDPVVEICEAGVRCTDTGLELIDIWRYFRHTWAHEYRSVPGRQMMVLVRNAARPNRPVMGIAMLASPVMRLTARDMWIGWLREAAQGRVLEGAWPAWDMGRAIWQRLEASIADIRYDDLATQAEVAEPTEAVSLRLEQRAAGAAFAREAELKAHFIEHQADGHFMRPHRGEVKQIAGAADWRGASDDLLFVRKRAEALSRLLFAKRIVQEAGLRRAPAKALRSLFASKEGQRALDIVLTEFRKAGLSSQVADVSICGAIHPYNELLGGKLVALLLASREVREAYARRYGSQVSVIASQMAGRPITKPADLRIITTTSLYGIGSSQYNRLKLRAADHSELPHDVIWKTIGGSLTGGYGTMHLSNETAHALRNMAMARYEARRVNNRFGEGTSPRLRQIREGLDALGLKSDDILHHATPRIFYGCELGSHARDALLGLASSNDEAPTCAGIAAAWRRRWLSRRALREETLAALGRLGPTSVRATLHADADGQFLLPIDD